MKLVHDNGVVRLYHGDARHLDELPDGSVHTAITSPPYWGLRDYGLQPEIFGGHAECEHDWQTERVQQEMRYGVGLADSPASTKGGGHKAAETPNVDVERSWCQNCGGWRGTLGLEPTPDLYIEHMVEVFREVRRVLRDDGTLWLNIGDSYSGSNKGMGADGTAYAGSKQATNKGSVGVPVNEQRGTMAAPIKSKRNASRWGGGDHAVPNLKPKDLVGIPWMLAFALRADGWWLRSDIIWSKPNPMPESVRDRPTRAHEYLFLLTKSSRYYYDAEAIRQPYSDLTVNDKRDNEDGHRRDRNYPGSPSVGGTVLGGQRAGGANKRSVWTVATQPYKDAHFAVFPEKLIEPCIMAGAPKGGLVLDPFCGSGTTCSVAQRLGRRAIGVDLSEEYLELAVKRIAKVNLPL